MKRIVQVAVTALVFSAGAAWSQEQSKDQIQAPQATESSDSYTTVAQASINAPSTAPAREEAKPQRKMSFHEWTGLAGDGVFPSRGGPLDD